MLYGKENSEVRLKSKLSRFELIAKETALHEPELMRQDLRHRHHQPPSPGLEEFSGCLGAGGCEWQRQKVSLKGPEGQLASTQTSVAQLQGNDSCQHTGSVREGTASNELTAQPTPRHRSGMTLCRGPSYPAPEMLIRGNWRL